MRLTGLCALLLALACGHRHDGPSGPPAGTGLTAPETRIPPGTDPAAVGGDELHEMIQYDGTEPRVPRRPEN
jgi:hypothetical protein